MADKDDKRSDREPQNSGQVRHDDRGNAVWQWAADTARTAMASTSQVLRKLDLTGLSLESDPTEEADAADGRKQSRSEASSKPTPDASPTAGKKRPVDTRKGGFDPYSTNAGTAKRAPTAAAAKSVGKAKSAPVASRQPEVSAPRRASWWRRLLGRG